MAGPTVIPIPERAIAGSTALDGLIEALAPLAADPTLPVCLDLSRLKFIGPTGLALLAAACGRATAIVEVEPPDDDGVAQYLARMDVLDPDALGVATPGSRGEPVGFRECRRFTTLDECVATSGSLVDAIGERVELPRPSRNALVSCIAELAENVVFHADSRDGGYAAAQSWPQRNAIEVGIVDLGRGIRASLAAHPAHAGLGDDVDAIESAFRLGVTATPERNSGQGLFTTARLLEDNGGRVLVRSGGAYVYDGARREGGAALNFPGTLVSLTIRTDGPLDGAAIARMIGNLTGADEESDDLFD